MNTYNYIGLSKQHAKQIADKLNSLLANYSIFYQNVRGFHWNIKGDKFFELHIKFEELYNDLQLKMDEIAERIVIVGGVPNHNFSCYINLSEIKETIIIHDSKTAIENILNSFQTILFMQRNLLEHVAQTNDEGTSTLMSDYIKFQEKQVWMYTAFINN
jgi:starvation-inducible DNA-binding protein